MYGIARPLLFTLEAERAHEAALAGLDLAWRTGAEGERLVWLKVR